MHRISPLITILPKTTPSRLEPRTSTKKIVHISIEEVEAANTAQKAWVAISNNVYDLTAFVDKHPGGRDFLLAAVGRDATAVFKSLHSAKTTKILNKYLIGTLRGATNVPQYGNESPFFEELKTRIDLFFKQNGKNPREAPLMLLSYVVILAVFVTMYMPMFCQPTSWVASWIPFLAAAISGWSCAMMGLYFCHDACHASFSNSPFVWNVIRRMYETFTGLNTLLWIYQHGLGHHPYTNVAGADPDIEGVGMEILRLNTSKPWWNFHRWQKYYWLPLYSQLVLSRKLGEFISVFYSRRWKFVKINPPQISEYFWISITLSIYAIHHYLVPYYYFEVSFVRLIALHTVTDLTWSMYLSVVLQASHVNNEVAWPSPSNTISSDWRDSDWAALQIESCLDFSHDDFWTTWLCGSLNYQAVHHLFPRVNQCYYPRMAPIVMQCCKEFGVNYRLKDNIWDMVKAHVARLEILGENDFVLR